MSNSRKKRRDAYWASLLSWEDVYPLRSIPDKHGSYAWSANGTMALMFEYEEVSDSERKEIIDCINGTSKDCPFKGQWQLQAPIEFLYRRPLYVLRSRLGTIDGNGRSSSPL